MREADFFETFPDGLVQCVLCPYQCRISPGKAGRCFARANRGGKLMAEGYGKITSMALDPIEKKPLRCFHPGSRILSLGSYGCNMRCSFCQNHRISMAHAFFEEVTPEAIAAESLRLASQGNIGVAYTYNEPLINLEFFRDTGKLIHAQGQVNVLVTNGFIRQEPLLALLPLVDAMNIDLKGFSEAIYEEMGGGFRTVCETIQMAAPHCHVEITALIIPGFNDSLEEMESLSSWVSGINREIPLHITRFFPSYRMTDKAPTDIPHIYRLADIAKSHLHNVYTGNC